jgi:hypothetical protein
LPQRTSVFMQHIYIHFFSVTKDLQLNEGSSPRAAGALPGIVTLGRSSFGSAISRQPPFVGLPRIRASSSPQSTDLTHKMLGSYFFRKRILDAFMRVAFYGSCARVLSMAGGSRRQLYFPDFQRFGRLQPLSNGFSSHGFFALDREQKPPENGWKKCVVNLYLVFGTDSGH